MKKLRKVLVVSLALILVIFGVGAIWFASTGTLTSARSLKKWEAEAKSQGIVLRQSDIPRIPETANGFNATKSFLKAVFDIPFKVTSPTAKLDLRTLTPEVQAKYDEAKLKIDDLFKYNQYQVPNREDSIIPEFFGTSKSTNHILFLVEHELLNNRPKNADRLIQATIKTSLLRFSSTQRGYNYATKILTQAMFLTKVHEVLKNSVHGKQLWADAVASSQPFVQPVDHKKIFQTELQEMFEGIEKEESRSVSWELIKELFGKEPDTSWLNFAPVRNATNADLARAFSLAMKSMKGTSRTDNDAAWKILQAECAMGCSLTKTFRIEVFSDNPSSVISGAISKLKTVMSKKI